VHTKNRKRKFNLLDANGKPQTQAKSVDSLQASLAILQEQSSRADTLDARLTKQAEHVTQLEDQFRSEKKANRTLGAYSNVKASTSAPKK